MNTIEKSGFPIDDYYIVNSKRELMKKVNELDGSVTYPERFHKLVAKEREMKFY
jgi:hypothetical protein